MAVPGRRKNACNHTETSKDKARNMSSAQWEVTLYALQRNLDVNVLKLGNLAKRWYMDSREVGMKP